MTTKSESACRIPTTVPDTLRRGDVAKILNLPAHRVDYLTRRGALPLSNGPWRDRCEWREYRPDDIAEFAERRGIVPNWQALSD